MPRRGSPTPPPYGTPPLAPPNVASPFIVSAKVGAIGGDAVPPVDFPATTRTLQVWHPWLYPFPGSIDFRVNAKFASAGAGTTKPAALRLQLPDSCKGIIRLVGWSLLNLTAASDIQWIVAINKQPVEGWQNLTFFPGNVPRITATEDAMIPVPIGGVIEIWFKNIDGAVYTDVGANFSGHYWDPLAEQVWVGEGP